MNVNVLVPAAAMQAAAVVAGAKATQTVPALSIVRVASHGEMLWATDSYRAVVVLLGETAKRAKPDVVHSVIRAELEQRQRACIGVPAATVQDAAKAAGKRGQISLEVDSAADWTVVGAGAAQWTLTLGDHYGIEPDRAPAIARLWAESDQLEPLANGCQFNTSYLADLDKIRRALANKPSEHVTVAFDGRTPGANRDAEPRRGAVQMSIRFDSGAVVGVLQMPVWRAN